jgi:hypothetical protein
MSYPQQDKIRGMSALLHRELQKAYEQGNSTLAVHYVAEGENVGVDVQAYSGHQANAADTLGVRGGEALNLFRYVCREGLVYLSTQSALSRTRGTVYVETLSNRGLLEIGKLPDPKERLLSGLEAALRDIQQNPSLGPEEKEEKLNAGREAIEFIRGLAVAVSARVLMGG